MEEFKEVTVILKDTDKRLRQKYPVYKPMHVSVNEPVIQECIQQTKKSFQGEPESITVTINLEVY